MHARQITLILAAFAVCGHALSSTEGGVLPKPSKPAVDASGAPKAARNEELAKSRGGLLRKESEDAEEIENSGEPPGPKNVRIARGGGSSGVFPIQLKEGLYSLIAQNAESQPAEPNLMGSLTSHAVEASAAAKIAVQAADTAAAEAEKARAAAARAAGTVVQVTNASVGKTAPPHASRSLARPASLVHVQGFGPDNNDRTSTMVNSVSDDASSTRAAAKTNDRPEASHKAKTFLEGAIDMIDVKMKELVSPPAMKHSDSSSDLDKKGSSNGNAARANGTWADVKDVVNEASAAADIAMKAADAAAQDAQVAMKAAQNAEAELAQHPKAVAKDDHKGKDGPSVVSSVGVPLPVSQGMRISSVQTSAPTEMNPENGSQAAAYTAATVAAQAAEVTAKSAQRAAQNVVEAVRAAQTNEPEKRTLETERMHSQEGSDDTGKLNSSNRSENVVQENAAQGDAEQDNTESERAASEQNNGHSDANENNTDTPLVQPDVTLTDSDKLNVTTNDLPDEKTKLDASKAQEAAVSAAVAAKVAEQTAHEAAIRATVASRTSEASTNVSVAQEDETMVPPRGIVLSLLLGLVITAFMLACLLLVFACGDQMELNDKLEAAVQTK